MKDYYDWILAFTPTKIYHRSAIWQEYNVLYYKYRIVPRDKFAALVERSTFFDTTLITCYLQRRNSSFVSNRQQKEASEQEEHGTHNITINIVYKKTLNTGLFFKKRLFYKTR